MSDPDLSKFGPDDQRPQQNKTRKMVKVFVFTFLLVGSLSVMLYMLAAMPDSTLRTVVGVVLGLNVVASAVNLYRTFRPHKLNG